MATGKRRSARTIGAREAAAIGGNLGRDLRRTRIRRRLTQAQLGDRIGVSQAEISSLEAGKGARTSIETWVAIGIALERPIAIGFSRDTADPLRDAGHLEAQELVIRLATAGGWHAHFEAPSRPSGPSHSTDVRLDRADGSTVLIEIWNRLDDLGAAVRSSDRKRIDVAGPLATPAASCWLLLDTASNRAIVRRYPAIVRARFGGSSGAWARAISSGGACPALPGIAWMDVKAGRLRELRTAGG